MKRSVVLLGKGTLAIRIASWFLNHSDYQLRMIVPVIPEPAWTESLCRWAAGTAYAERFARAIGLTKLGQQPEGTETAARRSWFVSPNISLEGNSWVRRYTSSTIAIACCHTRRSRKSRIRPSHEKSFHRPRR